MQNNSNLISFRSRVEKSALLFYCSKEGGEDLARLELSVYLADIEPIRSLISILSHIAEDERVPLSYRVDIGKALLPWLAEGKEVDG